MDLQKADDIDLWMKLESAELLTYYPAVGEYLPKHNFAEALVIVRQHYGDKAVKEFTQSAQKAFDKVEGTENGYAKEVPKEDGLYWFKYPNPKYGIEIIRLSGIEVCGIDWNYPALVTDEGYKGGSWKGPIKEEALI